MVGEDTYWSEPRGRLIKADTNVLECLGSPSGEKFVDYKTGGFQFFNWRFLNSSTEVSEMGVI